MDNKLFNKNPKENLDSRVNMIKELLSVLLQPILVLVLLFVITAILSSVANGQISENTFWIIANLCIIVVFHLAK